MKYLTFLLISIGTIGAAAGVAQTDPSAEGWQSQWQVNNLLAGTSLALLAVGVGLRRWDLYQSERRRGREREDWQRLREALKAINEKLAELQKAPVSPDTHFDRLFPELDYLLEGPITTFVQNRSAISTAFGIAHYSEVMGSFAQGERYLNRAWSASVDDYPDEVADYTARAVAPFKEAEAKLRALG